MRLVDIEDGIQPLDDLEYIYRPYYDGAPWYHADDVYDRLNKCPVVDASIIGHASWIKSDVPCEGFRCSHCGGGAWYYDSDHNISKSRYCPSCGYRMDRDRKCKKVAVKIKKKRCAPAGSTTQMRMTGE